ncbi:MAG: PD-(D/E)XK nuclease family protein [Ignavibacteria bacterium]|nr:PD-(D/E)XK nuclease family protein [Ignavibacteria bacterium]
MSEEKYKITKPFLEKLAEELLKKFGNDISGMQVVFPSRRAGIYFKKYLSKNISLPLWVPVTSGIADFISDNTDNQIADELILIFELYKIYAKYADDVTFDKFYPWGEIILRDFDEIDKNLVDATYLFRILREHKQIEADFELIVSDIEGFYRFWNTFSGRDITNLQEEFIKTWEILGKVYHEFRKTMKSKNICNEGMAYRRLYEKVKTGDFNNKFSKVIFAGFNQLNKCEEGIIKELIKQGDAEFYADGDMYYYDDNTQEAGRNLIYSLNFLGLNEVKWIENNLLTDSKSVKIIGAPLQIPQTKVLGNELTKLSEKEKENTVIVLPDDGLLLPVLNSLPPEVRKVNITMGYSLKNTLLYTLLKQLKDLYNNKSGTEENPAFYYKDVINLLMHPYIKKEKVTNADDLINIINKRNIIYVSIRFLKSYYKEIPHLLNIIINLACNINSLTDDIYKLLEEIEKNLAAEKDNKYDNEFLYRAFKEINHVFNILKNYDEIIQPETIWDIILEKTASAKIPFEGEPLKGLQIMGLLETRQLDFDNVFILSVNEGILPSEIYNSSFIPYSLRKAFRLPLNEDSEAASAYNFYRLLQKAKNITLIYNAEAGAISGGEKSRFILQLENELGKKNKNVTIEKYIFSGDIKPQTKKEIIVEKSSDIIERLKNEKQFSASTLSLYINCPLQFYLKKIAKLKEKDEAEEYFSSGAFGDIFHKIMEDLYKGFENKILEENDISSMIKKINREYDDIWKAACNIKQEYAVFSEIRQGKNLLYKGIIQKLVTKVLEEDKKQIPFKILDIEQESKRDFEININGEKIHIPLLGRLDRIELKDNITRIVDYKTGSVKITPKGKLSDEEQMDKIYNDINLKENFQQLFYASLYLNHNPETKLVIGIYPLKKISGGIEWFEKEPINKYRKALFEEKLREMLVKIFDDTTPFIQTEDLSHCKYCSYKTVCYRD